MQSTTFADLGLSPKVETAIADAGYTIPTPIQAAAIPVALTGQDVLGIAQTGTGKTASFTLPMITRLEKGRARARMPRSLILAPTRELAAQVAQSFEKYGVNHKLNVALLIGGVSMDEQSRKLDRGVDVLIATPGRLMDHFQRGRVMLMGVEILVIDEADRMLDMGFIPDIEKICKLLPPKRQTLFFSATMPPEITRLVDQFMNKPERIEVARPASTAQTITQRFKFCPEGDDWAKREILRELLRTVDVKNAIIFCNRKRDVAILQKSLSKHGFDAGALHGDMDQRSRTETLDKFRAGDLAILAASDVAARGLDIPDVSHVFNFDLPRASSVDDYVHRIGRTGRAGKEGAAFSLVTHDDLAMIGNIEKLTGDTAEWIGDPPTEEDLESGASKKRRRGGKSTSSSRGSERAPRSRSGRGSPTGERSKPAEQSSGERGGERRRSSSRQPAVEVEAISSQTDQPILETDIAAIDAPQPNVGAQPTPENESRLEPRGEANTQPDGEKSNRRRGGRRGGSGRSAAKPDHAAASPPQEAKPAARRKRSNRDRKAGTDGEALSAPAAGFADNIPAFLRRPVRRPKPSTAADEDNQPAAQQRETESASD